jgi:hypothetical protein
MNKDIRCLFLTGMSACSTSRMYAAVRKINARQSLTELNKCVYVSLPFSSYNDRALVHGTSKR